MKLHKPITAAIALLLLAANPVWAQNTNENRTITPPSTSDWDIPSSAQEGDQVDIKYTGDKYVKSVKVVPLPTSVTIKTTDCLAMMVGETLSLQAEIYPDITGVDKTVTWAVSSGNAVTIDADGKVTAVQAGDATVKVTTNTNNKTDALTISVKTIPSNCVAGVFSVGECKRVCFSKGNLQYQPSSSTWRFAQYQYTLLDDNTTTHNTTSYTPTSADWIDLFGWGMWLDEITDKAKITNTSTTNSDYAPALNSDNEFASNKRTVDGAEWMTLSYSEWYYLRYTRTNASKLFGVATVNGVNGLILLPDGWTDPKPDGKEFKSGVASSSGVDYYKTVNEYTAAQWIEMESAGAVFLPAAGYRNGASVDNVGYGGYYWSSAAHSATYACYLGFNSGNVYAYNGYRCDGQSVRLVRSL
ncbi:MAG: Ig-like domain-containing protein [Bacteroidales bacterium]|nr:Ig-like domain-containing protein [Bacteroidales bacterium]